MPETTKKRPDPYADERTMLRRKRGVAVGLYQGLTIFSLTGLVLASFYVDLISGREIQGLIAAATVAIAGGFVFVMSRRKSRSVETPRARLLIGSWLALMLLLWCGMALVLVLPVTWTWDWGQRAAVFIGLAALLTTIVGIVGFTAMYGRDWASRQSRQGQVRTA